MSKCVKPHWKSKTVATFFHIFHFFLFSFCHKLFNFILPWCSYLARCLPSRHIIVWCMIGQRKRKAYILPQGLLKAKCSLNLSHRNIELSDKSYKIVNSKQCRGKNWSKPIFQIFSLWEPEIRYFWHVFFTNTEITWPYVHAFKPFLSLYLLFSCSQANSDLCCPKTFMVQIYWNDHPRGNDPPDQSMRSLLCGGYSHSLVLTAFWCASWQWGWDCLCLECALMAWPRHKIPMSIGQALCKDSENLWFSNS